MRLFRNQQEVAVGYIPKKDSPHQMKELRYGEVCVVITSTEVTDLAPGDSVGWNEKGLRPLKKAVNFKVGGVVRMFYNDINIGLGVLKQEHQKGNKKLSVLVAEVYEINLISSELLLDKEFKKGSIINWNIENLEPQSQEVKVKILDYGKRTLKKIRKGKGRNIQIQRGSQRKRW